MASNFQKDDNEDDNEPNIYHDNRFKRINSFTNEQFAKIRPTTHTSLDRRLHISKQFWVIKLKTIAVTLTILAVFFSLIHAAILLNTKSLTRSYSKRVYFKFPHSYCDPKTCQKHRVNREVGKDGNCCSKYCGGKVDFNNEKDINSNGNVVKLRYRFKLIKTKQQGVFGLKLCRQQICSPSTAKQFDCRNGNADTADKPLVSPNSHFDIIHNFQELFNLLRYEFVVFSLTGTLLIKIVRDLLIAIIITIFGLLRNYTRIVSKFIRNNIVTIEMDNKTTASNQDSDQNFRTDQINELNSTGNKTNNCGVDEAIKLLRQSSFPQITSRTSQNTASPTIKRVSYEHRCRSRSPRKIIIATTRRSESLDGNIAISLAQSTPISHLSTASLSLSTTTSIPTTIQSSSSTCGGGGNSRSNRNCPKIFEPCPSDDKENESPIPSDSVQSPKMKLTENALAQQNSPRHFDTTRQRFSFSPKLIYTTAATTDDSSMPNYGEQIVGNTSLSSTAGSPLLSSAIYKHGNYFKFPEVDCFTPDKLANFSSSNITISANVAKIMTTTATTVTDEKITTSAGQKLSPGQKQGTRRARLKSISLDSDGAKLVEDNLGVPVEELIEVTNESPPDLDIPNRTVANSPDAGEIEANSAAATTVVQLNRKNKNKLTIQIDNPSRSSNVLPSVKVQTPTLTQTKQKAVSLDSSDTQNSDICYYSSTSPSSATTIPQKKYSVHENHTPMSRSMQQVSSISVPTTPKRNVLIARRKPYCKTTKSKLSSGGSNGNGVGSSAVSLSIFDCKEQICESIIGDERSMRIAIDIDDNTDACNGTEIDEAHFYLDEVVDDEVLVVTEEYGGQPSSVKISDLRKRSKMAAPDALDASSNNSNTGDYLLLGTNLQTQKYGMLSLSNNNLETLPEIMTLSDFTGPTVTESNTITIAVTRTSASKSSQQLSSELKPATTVTSATKPTAQTGRSILQRRGSNHSLTINLNGSLGNLSKCMSVSNYSLGSFSGSNYNLNCSQHYASTICRQIPSNTSSTQSIEAALATVTAAVHGSSSNQTRNSVPGGSHPPDIQRQVSVESVEVAQLATKRNLLQRRGSNTSLTLNLKGSNQVNLSRFSSHSALNIAASLTSGSIKLKQPPTHLHGPYQHPYSLQQQSLMVASTGKKGLLERRNSNASLTLNICNVAGLSNSNCNLRSSASSLQNITNTSTEFYDRSATQSQFGNAEEIGSDASEQAAAAAAMIMVAPRQQRKFLSSENLNSMMFSSNKLNQTHVRNSTKTCFGSVSDLKPHQSSSGDGDIQFLNSDKFSSHQDHDPTNSIIVIGRGEFEQPTLCSCTGVRNITTKPLSPQSTSEDFKMYLANIQLLQNATNILTDEYLRKLHSIFMRSYEKVEQSSRTKAAAIATLTARLTDFENFETHHCQQLNEQAAAAQFDFNVLPSDNEKRHLLRTLHEEFWDLPTNHQEKPLVFGSQSKNRYKTILPNEHSRVILENEPNSMHEPYINANYIKGPDYAKNAYIVTQGPLPNTIYDHWLMIAQNVQRHRSKSAAIGLSSPQKIVMLTNFIENNQQKCSIYFPVELNDALFITSTNEKFENSRLAQFYDEYLQVSLLQQRHVDGNDSRARNNFDEFDIRIGNIDGNAYSSPIPIADIPKKNYFLIKNFGIDRRNGFAIRKLVCLYVITRDNGNNATQHMIEQSLNRFICYHYWFPDWPDHHSPTDVSLLLDMTLDILDAQASRESAENQTNRDVTDNAIRSHHQIEQDDESIILEAIVANRNRDAYEPIPIIHCSAGIGRTGCLAAILNGVEQIRSSTRLTLEPWNYQLNSESIQYLRTTKNYVNVDVLGIVCNLRLQRGGMVQNSEQYELIHRALCLYQIRIDATLKIWNGSVIAAPITNSSGSATDNNRTGLSDSMTDKNTLNQNVDLEQACV